VFISFEGGEGAGKTTLIGRIDAELSAQGRKTLVTRAPGGTPTGNHIREILLHKDHMSPRCELLLFLADRSQHVDEVIFPALEKGITVLCDRFNDSTIAYQAGARGFELAWVQKLCAFATKNLQPDLTLYLDLDPEEGFKRMSRPKDRIEEAGLDFHRKIRAAYLAIAGAEPERFYVLDASQTPEKVFQEALHVLSSHR